VNDDFVKTLGAKLEQGGAALIVLGRAQSPERVIERVKPYGGEIIQTSLDPDAEEHLKAALGEEVAAS
jgi:uncharacterized membrane protein